MADKTFTYSDVSAHSTKKDLYMVVHDKVYNASSFVDEHPYVPPLFPVPSLVPSFREEKKGSGCCCPPGVSPTPHRT